MADRRDVAKGLMMLAFDILTFDRKMPTGSARTYTPDPEESGFTDSLQVVPQAVHDLLCNSVAVLLDDETEQVFVCAHCYLAVETGTPS